MTGGESQAAAPKTAARRRGLWPIMVGLALVLLAAFFAIGDLKKFLAIASDVRPLWLLVAVAATGVAYLAFTGALWAAARISGHERAFADVLPTSFVSQAVNNLLSSGGLGGLAIRIYGLGQLGITAGSSAAISGVATISNDVVTAVGLIVSIVYLIEHSEDLSTRALYSLTALGAAVAAFFVVAFFAIRSPRMRRRVFNVVGRYGEAISKRFVRQGAAGVVAGNFREDLLATAEHALVTPRKLLEPFAWMCLDIGFRCVCLWAAFMSIGHPQPLRRVAAGFMIGISAGALSLVPGGIGVLDGSMAAVFSFLGVQFEVAAIGVIVFRLAFYVIPMGAVSLFFRPLLRSRTPASAGGSGP